MARGGVIDGYSNSSVITCAAIAMLTVPDDSRRLSRVEPTLECTKPYGLPSLGQTRTNERVRKTLHVSTSTPLNILGAH